MAGQALCQRCPTDHHRAVYAGHDSRRTADNRPPPWSCVISEKQDT